MGEEVYCLSRLVCCAGGLIGQLPGEDSGVLTVPSAIHRIDPGQDRMDVVLVSLCTHNLCVSLADSCAFGSARACIAAGKGLNRKDYALCPSLEKSPREGYIGLLCGFALLQKERPAQDGNTGMSGSIIASVSLDTDLTRQC